MSRKVTYSPWAGLAAYPTSETVHAYGSDAHKKQYYDDELNLTSELIQRYGPEWREMADSLHKDLGLDKAKIRMRNVPMRPGHLGTYIPEQNRIVLNNEMGENQRYPTTAHEMAHAADTLHEGYSSPASNYQRDEPIKHHKHFVNFDEEFPVIMAAQRERQEGWPVHPDILRRYPFLKSVVPLSSNRLANPWNIQESLTKLLKQEQPQMTQEKGATEQMMDSLRKLGLNPRISKE